MAWGDGGVDGMGRGEEVWMAWGGGRRCGWHGEMEMVVWMAWGGGVEKQERPLWHLTVAWLLRLQKDLENCSEKALPVASLKWLHTLLC